MTDLLSNLPSRQPAPLTVFQARLDAHAQQNWQDVFAGFSVLRAITFSSSLEFLLDLAEQFEDMEIIFGAEHILTKTHLALVQASQVFEAYGFRDCLADQKSLVEGLRQLLGPRSSLFLPRLHDGTLRFRLMTGRPSHEKLYLLSGPDGHRVVTGSANLSLSAFHARQHEVIITFDDPTAWHVFEDYYQRDYKQSVPVEDEILIGVSPTAKTGQADIRTDPIPYEDVPIVRAIRAGLAHVEQGGIPMPDGFSATALRMAQRLRQELETVPLPMNRKGMALVTPRTVSTFLQARNNLPAPDRPADDIPRAILSVRTGEVHLNDRLWLSEKETIPAEQVARDARMLVAYISSFAAFYGNSQSAMASYWAFLVWLYMAPFAAFLRQGAVINHIDPWLYPPYAVLYGRSSGGKTLFTRIIAQSMFGIVKSIRSSDFTAQRALALRFGLGAIPLLIDDVTPDRMGKYVPDMVRTDHDMAERYAPIVLTTNKDVTSISADLTKRMVTCHIDASLPDSRALQTESPRRLQKEIGTALYRQYLTLMLPQIRAMRIEMDQGAGKTIPDAFAISSRILLSLLEQHVSPRPDWACPLSYRTYQAMRAIQFQRILVEMIGSHPENIILSRDKRFMRVRFGGDIRQAVAFEKSVPEFVFKGRIADTVKLDLLAMEEELGFSPVRNTSLLGRVVKAWKKPG